MPPSPALRCSPVREQRMENSHKRGRSFESGMTLGAKDDDLALFNEIQNNERDSFLLHASNDVDDSLSKLRYFSDVKLGITIPVRGESTDLLNVDGEKCDYDWLLTPPDTPLFPSLDDEEPQAPDLLPRGRPRSQPINISRSSPMSEKAHRNSRSSASPHRLSPSPRSSNNFGQMQPRPSLAPRSSPSPPLALRPVTSSRTPSTPPNKPLSPTPRSSTPTPRRMSTGSSGQASPSGRRGASPMRASRGNSASPKLRGWQSNLPGFSSDAPPNLLTSTADRVSPHARGLSPTPASRKGRQSMSPSASRRSSSSHSNDRDRFSSYSRGSVVSSGDEDMDSLHSVAISSSPARRNGMSINNSRPMSLSKKPSRTSPSNSIPKRSFESVLHQMEHRKTPQNMFRPLLSSVPATTFYGGKSTSTYKPMFSRNSSLTTSTSASSDQGASVAPDLEGSEHGEWERTHDIDSQQDVFIFEKPYIIEDSGQELHAGKSLIGRKNVEESMIDKVDAHNCEGSTDNFLGVSSRESAAESASADDNFSVVNGCELVAICSKCGKCFRPLGVDRSVDVCQECADIDELVAVKSLLYCTLTHTQKVQSETANERDLSVNGVQVMIPELHEKNGGKVFQIREEAKGEHELNCMDSGSPLQLLTDQSESHLSDEQIESQHSESSTQCATRSNFEQTEPPAHSGLRIDNHEGTGISVLLMQRSSSSKCPFVQARAFSATNVLCSQPSYVRDNSSAVRCSISPDIASASSSIDLGSSKQTKVQIQHQFSSGKNEIDCVLSDTCVKSQSSESHSDFMRSASEPLIHYASNMGENFNSFTDGVKDDASQEPNFVRGECISSFEPIHMGAINFTYNRPLSVSGSLHLSDDSSADTSVPQLNHAERRHFETSLADSLNSEDCTSRINANGDPWEAIESISGHTELPSSIPDIPAVAEESSQNGHACQSVFADAATNSSGVAILQSQNDGNSNVEAFRNPIVSTTADHAHGAHEESTVIVEVPQGHMSRSLTLEEATDTILFCSSIIHDIAYKAAAIAIDKEPLEASRPMVTILGKSDLNLGQKTITNRRSPRSEKFKRKRFEHQTKSPLKESDNNVTIQESTQPVNADKIQNKALNSSTKPLKLESKCNCTVM